MQAPSSRGCATRSGRAEHLSRQQRRGSAFPAGRFAGKAAAFLEAFGAQVVVSDFVAAEFSSVVAIRLRNRDLTASAARLAFSNFDSWSDLYAASAKTVAPDVEVAKTFIRRLDLPLRTPDAINLAIARRLELELATFDKQMATAARRLGIYVARL